MSIKYFDNAATTNVKKEVLDEMLPYLKDGFGNIYEKSPVDMHHRLAKEIARIENAAGKRTEQAVFFFFVKNQRMRHIRTAFARIIGRYKTYGALNKFAAFGKSLRVKRRKFSFPNKRGFGGGRLVVVHDRQFPLDKFAREPVRTRKSIVPVRFIEHAGARRHSRI